MATVIENLEELSVNEVTEQFDVTREQVEAVLEFVAESLRFEAFFSPPLCRRRSAPAGTASRGRVSSRPPPSSVRS